MISVYMKKKKEPTFSKRSSMNRVFGQRLEVHKDLFRSFASSFHKHVTRERLP